jgi:hypothetical protein
LGQELILIKIHYCKINQPSTQLATIMISDKLFFTQWKTF